MSTQTIRGEAFAALHRRPTIFAIPNPWDAGSAKMLAALGFEALATTSAGLAFSLGRPDGEGALTRRHETHQRVAQGRLAHAVASDDGDRFDPHRERDVVEHLRAAVAGAQVVHGKQRGGGGGGVSHGCRRFRGTPR